jgi:hypothetical protein
MKVVVKIKDARLTFDQGDDSLNFMPLDLINGFLIKSKGFLLQFFN